MDHRYERKAIICGSEILEKGLKKRLSFVRHDEIFYKASHNYLMKGKVVYRILKIDRFACLAIVITTIE